MLIKKAKDETNPEHREEFIEYLANLMKKQYLSWNRDSVNDEVIIDHLISMSDNQLKPNANLTLEQTSDILSKIPTVTTNTPKRKRKNGKGFSSNNGRSRKKFAN